MGFEGMPSFRRAEIAKTPEGRSMKIEELVGEDGKYYSVDHNGVVESVTTTAIGFEVRVAGIPMPLRYERNEEINVHLLD